MSISGLTNNKENLEHQYKYFCSDIDTKIQILDQLPHDVWKQEIVNTNRTELYSLHGRLYPVYFRDFEANSSVETFKAHCSEIVQKANTAFTAIFKDSSIIKDKIQSDNTQATKIVSELSMDLSDQPVLDSAKPLLDKLDALEKTHPAQLPSIKVARSKIKVLETLIDVAKTQLAPLQEKCKAFTAQDGLLSQLTKLASVQSPTQDDLFQSFRLLSTAAQAQSDLQIFEQNYIAPIVNELVNIKTYIEWIETAKEAKSAVKPKESFFTRLFNLITKPFRAIYNLICNCFKK